MSLLCLALTVATLADTVAPLPKPSGPLPVGTTIAYLTDFRRHDTHFPNGRPITLQLWYPAQRVGTTMARYLVEPRLGDVLKQQQYYGMDSATLDRWAQLVTHSSIDAPPAAGRYPLLAFSVGLGVIRANYTSIAEELASHGYVVAIVESPLQGLMALPDGRTVVDSTGEYGEPGPHRIGVQEWAGDISFALDTLSRARRSSPLAQVARAIDTTRIGAIGHSSGGLVAIAACEADRRLRACVNMDGGVAGPDHQPLADFVTRGVSKPTLFLRSQPLYDDTTLARRGITREQWVQRGEAGRVAFDTLRMRSRGPLWVALVAGTGHFSYSDAPFVMPSAIARFGGRIIAPSRGWTVITTAVRAFFDRELGPRGSGSGLRDLPAQVPELTVSVP